ncbi:MAG: bacterial Ig-like domain-containing protein [Clostridia bacterium]|nr:bacterial Ig-like domain-containing protein [Clostridia bacterium]
MSNIRKRAICLICVLCLFPAVASAAASANLTASIADTTEVGDVFLLTVSLEEMSVNKFLSCDVKIEFDSFSAVPVDENGEETQFLSDALEERLAGNFKTYIKELSSGAFEVMCAGDEVETLGSIELFAIRFKRVSSLPLYFSATYAAAFLDDAFTAASINCENFFAYDDEDIKVNLLTNGDFESISGTNITDWTVGAGSKGKTSVQQMTTSNFAYNSEGDNHYITSTGQNSGTNLSGAIKRYLQLEPNKTYTVTYKIKSTFSGGQMWFGPSITDANGLEITTSNGYSAAQMQTWREETNSLVPGKIDGDYSTITASNEWETRTRVLHTTDEWNLLLINMRWMSAGVSFDDFAVYEGTISPVSSVEVTAPSKTEYILGEELDTSDMIVTVNYADNTSQITEDYTISGFGAQKIGPQKVNVLYKGNVSSFEVFVSANNLVAQASSEKVSLRGDVTEVFVDVPIYNPDAAKNAVLVMVLFENERLVKASLKKLVLESGFNSVSLSEMVEGSIRGITARVFLWNDVMMPLAQEANILY